MITPAARSATQESGSADDLRHAASSHPERSGPWAAFVAANKRFCHGYLQPRLYAMSHMTALMWWFGHHLPRQSRGGALLEFGCGKDFPICRLVGPQFAACYATDVEAQDPAVTPPGVDFRLSVPGAPLPFATGSMDAVAIRSVMEHVEDPAAVFTEIGRVMMPGGRVFMNLPNRWDYVSVLARLSGRFKSTLLRNVTRPTWDDFPVFYRCNTKRALTRAVADSGLEIELFRPWPSEPSYLKFFVPLYVAGAIYQFAISLFGVDVLQPSFVVILRKRPGGKDGML